MGANLAASLGNISGVGIFYICPLTDATRNASTFGITAVTESNEFTGGIKMEALALPSMSDLATGEFDGIGYMNLDSVEKQGDEPTITKHKYTDGTIALTAVTDGTFGLKGATLNAAPEMCKKLLNMRDVSATGTGLGKGLVYGVDANGNSAMGLINPAMVYIEFLQSPDYKGIFIPYAMINTTLVAKGNKNDVWTLDLTIDAQKCPTEIPVTVATKDYDYPFTTATTYGGASYALIEK